MADVSSTLREGGRTWFNAANLFVKESRPNEAPFLSAKGVCESESKDVLLLYDSQDDQMACMTPKYVARKVPLPLTIPTDMRTLSIIPEDAIPCTLESSGSEYTVGGQSYNADLSTMAKQATYSSTVAAAKEKIPITVAAAVSKLPSWSIVIPCFVVSIDMVISVVGLTQAFKHDKAKNSTLLLFFFLGICCPNIVALVLILKRSLWLQTLALHFILWSTIGVTCVVSLCGTLFILHPPLMCLVWLYIIRCRTCINVSQCYFIQD